MTHPDSERQVSGRLVAFVLAASFGSLLCSDGVRAGAGVWSSSGPEGGPVTAIIRNPATAALYVGTAHNGVYGSIDGGTSWTAATGAPREVAQLAIAANEALYALGGAAEPGVFQSLDGGTTWRTVLAEAATAVATDPTAADTVYAFVPETGVFKTINAGVTWTSSSLGLVDVIGRHLIVDPLTPTTIYLGSRSNAVLKSTDGGVSWTTQDQGIPDVGISSLIIDPLSPATLYAATTDGLFKTIAGAQLWTPLTEPPGFVDVLALDPAAPATLWAGSFGRIFHSTDSGASWTEPSSVIPATEIHALVVDSASPGTVYAGTGSGPIKTTNGGLDWVEVVSGLRSVLIDRLVIDPSAPQILYAVSPESGIFKSVDAGGSWQAINEGISDRRVRDLAIAPSHTQIVYAAQPRGLRSSADGGTLWTDPVTDAAAFGLFGPVISSLEVDPAAPGNVLAGHSADAFLGGGPGVYRSADGAATWLRVLDPMLEGSEPGEIDISPTSPTEALAAFDGTEPGVFGRKAALFLSNDGGANWIEVHRQIGKGPVPLAWDPLDADTAYAVISPGAGFEVLKSGDGGGTWAAIAVGAPCVNDLLPDPVVAGTLWVGCDPAWMSTNGGATWTPFDATGFPVGAGGALTLEFASGPTPTLHAGTEVGVYSYGFPLTADLAITKDNGVSELDPGDALTYSLVVSNLGPEDVIGALVTDVLPADLTCTWTCTPTGGAQCLATPPAGDLNQFVDLPVGNTATYTGSCTVDLGAGGFLVNTATVSPPDDRLDPESGNDNDLDTDVVLEIGSCGVANDRILSATDLDIAQEIEACHSITAQSAVTISADIVLRAPKVQFNELQVFSGSLRVVNETP